MGYMINTFNQHNRMVLPIAIGVSKHNTSRITKLNIIDSNARDLLRRSIENTTRVRFNMS